ncbi:hypothetical protein IAR55_003808 [Kwoniella newhampshirensis]|uniref:Uncharacterized protein n=1 Tax=Kwoniella newhampshirensis TaxID=1651941 RepID=A0AAW0YKQ1_9TREE
MSKCNGTLAPAPTPGRLSLLPPQRTSPKKDYSEGSMYEELDAEDLEVWRRRYATFKQWRIEVPNRKDQESGVSSASSFSNGKGVGVGSADWNWRDQSDCGTIPSTVVQGGRKVEPRVRARPQAERPAPIRHHPASRKTPIPLVAHPPPTTQSSLRPNLVHRPSTRASSGSPAQGELVIPSPSPSAGYAETEAYIASALHLPLEILSQTTHGVVPPRIPTSSKLTTGRLGSLLSKRRDRLSNRIEKSTSSTTTPSFISRRLDEETKRSSSGTPADPSHSREIRIKLDRGQPVGAVLEGDQRITDPIHMSLPRGHPSRSRPPTEATVARAARQSLPFSSPNPIASEVMPYATASRNSAARNHQTDARSVSTARDTPSAHTIKRFARTPLPSSATNTYTSQVKVPISVKTTDGSVPNLSRLPPNPSISGSEDHVIGEEQPLRRDNGRDIGPFPNQISLPSSVYSFEPDRTSAPIATTHRQQPPLPRPAITPHTLLDSQTGKRTSCHRHRAPSAGDLTAHFEPALYPLPPSSSTVVSTPETRAKASAHLNPKHTSAAVVPSRADSSESVIPEFASHLQRPARIAPSKVAPSRTVSPTLGKRYDESPSLPEALHTSSRESASHDVRVTSQGRKAQVEVDTLPSAHKNQYLLHRLPASTPLSIRSNEDQVSFEVPQGSKGRLRVTLRWIWGGKQSLSGSDSGVPPPLPPKNYGLLDRVNPVAGGGETPAQCNNKDRYRVGATSSDSKHIVTERNQPGTSFAPNEIPTRQRQYPIPGHLRPPLDPPPWKHNETKRSPLVGSYQFLTPTGVDQPQYYSGASLPAYRPPHQIYNAQVPPVPFAYPQPRMKLAAYQSAATLNGLGMQSPLAPSSPARESEDPLFEERLLLPSGAPGLIGSGLIPFQHQAVQPHKKQRFWYSQPEKLSVWQRIFRRNREDGNHATIRNWRKGVNAGRAPTTVPYINNTRAPSTIYPPVLSPTITMGQYQPAVRGDRSPYLWKRSMWRRRKMDEDRGVSMQQRDQPGYTRRKGDSMPRGYMKRQRQTNDQVGLFTMASRRRSRQGLAGHRDDMETKLKTRRIEEKENRRRERAARRDEREQQLAHALAIHPRGNEGAGRRGDMLVKVSGDRPLIEGGRARIGNWIKGVSIRNRYNENSNRVQADRKADRKADRQADRRRLGDIIPATGSNTKVDQAIAKEGLTSRSGPSQSRRDDAIVRSRRAETQVRDLDTPAERGLGLLGVLSRMGRHLNMVDHDKRDALDRKRR